MSNPSGLDLKLARIRTGQRQYRVAQRLGIPASLLCDYENGRRPLSPERAETILRAIQDLALQPAERFSDAIHA
jgi:DNA-binding transcriptional regulator YdaS (Cro superfamily)